MVITIIYQNQTAKISGNLTDYMDALWKVILAGRRTPYIDFLKE